MPNQYWSVYYANAKVLIPTEVKTTAGVFRHEDPMEVIDVDNTVELKRAILATIAKGNPIVPHPSQEKASKINIHKKLGFKSYKMFNHSAILREIKLSDGRFSIQFWEVAKDGRGYDPDREKEIIFSVGTPVETVVNKLIEIIQQAHREASRTTK